MHSSLKLHAQRAAAAARCRPALQQCLWGTSSSSSGTSSSSSTSSSRVPFGHSSDVRTMATKRGATATKTRKAPFIDEVQWQAPLEIIKYPDPRLRAVNANLSPAAFNDNLKALAKEMFKIMYTDDGVGLAAPQVGVNIRLMVFNETAEPGHEKETVLVNPEIVSTTAQNWTDEEGCLSFPDMRADVERHEGIRVRALNEEGQPIQLELNGWEARIFQHEFDHLTGTLFHDRMKPSELEKVRPQLVAMEDSYLAQHAGAEIQRVPPPKQPKVSKGFGSK